MSDQLLNSKQVNKPNNLFWALFNSPDLEFNDKLKAKDVYGKDPITHVNPHNHNRRTLLAPVLHRRGKRLANR